jgi:hypothetical protein
MRKKTTGKRTKFVLCARYVNGSVICKLPDISKLKKHRQTDNANSHSKQLLVFGPGLPTDSYLKPATKKVTVARFNLLSSIQRQTKS